MVRTTIPAPPAGQHRQWQHEVPADQAVDSQALAMVRVWCDGSAWQHLVSADQSVQSRVSGAVLQIWCDGQEPPPEEPRLPIVAKEGISVQKTEDGRHWVHVSWRVAGDGSLVIRSVEVRDEAK